MEEQPEQPNWALLEATLSAEAFQALKNHVNGVETPDPPPRQETLEEAAKKQAVLEDTMARLRAQATVTEGVVQRNCQEKSGDVALVASDSVREAVTTLREKGCVRLNQVLSESSCDELLAAVEAQLHAKTSTLAEDELIPASGFGTVLVRNNRYDMYIPHEGVYAHALDQMLGAGNSHPILGDFFRELFEGKDLSKAVVRELSTLIADPGAPRQPLHPDVHFHPYPQLYSCFVALQDVDESMGPTVFLPGTHNELDHATFNGPELKKAEFLKNQEYRSSLLKKGDCAIFEARLLHCGSANESDKRRTMFYLTLQDPEYLDVHVPCCVCEEDQKLSKFPEVELSLRDFD
eukprot:TRINITY_DN49397_c0_g1_i1.p1 TRINITY_DN49397_c0_g1~~TRINITY_DN49397_c0_g1_i1.p1  ORF type:complete len:349 (-),score=88.12 TRINITY_DN49397_c0_g1_i1:341-1387(-)